MFLRCALIFTIFFGAAFAAAPVYAEPECSQKKKICFGINWETAIPAHVAGVEVDAQDKYHGGTPLHWAVVFNENQAVAAALLKTGADLEAQDKHGNTPLHSAAMFSENPAVITALLEAGANVGVRNNNGDTPLHKAASWVNKNPAVITILLQAGADVGARNKRGETPLHKAAFLHETPERITALLEAGADVEARDKYGDTSLHWATQSATSAGIIALLKAGADVDAQNKRKETPLHWAAGGNQNPAATTALLQAGADVGARDDYGETPLHRAAYWNRNNNPEVITALLEAGADVEAQNEGGETPLHKAARRAVVLSRGYENIIILLKAGANPKLKNASDKTPFDIVKESESLEGTKIYWALHDAQFKKLESSSLIAPESASNLSPAETAFENGWRSVVVVQTDERQGSGVVVKPNLVATNCHVVNGGDIVVYKADSRRAQTDTAHRAHINRADEKRDLCLLDAPGLWGIPAEIRQAETLRVGEAVFAIGAPKGLEYSLSAGVVSQLRADDGENAPYVQTDAAISPGSSGGGLFDGEGRLVGITTFKGIGKGEEGITFAIPAEWILQMK